MGFRSRGVQTMTEECDDNRCGSIGILCDGCQKVVGKVTSITDSGHYHDGLYCDDCIRHELDWERANEEQENDHAAEKGKE